MITTFVHSEFNRITWHEFHEHSNDNSMECITERVIGNYHRAAISSGHYDLNEKLRNFQPVLHELCYSIQKATNDLIKRKFNFNT